MTTARSQASGQIVDPANKARNVIMERPQWIFPVGGRSCVLAAALKRLAPMLESRLPAKIEGKTEMPNREIRKHWETVHSEKQDAVSWFQGRPEISLNLVLGEGLARDTPVIDIGGGASRLVDCLLDEGFADVTVLDIADSGLARTRDRLGERAAAVNWLVADVTRWKPSREYGAWHDRAVFHFLVSADDREAYRQVLRSGVQLGGRIVIGTFAEDGPGHCSGLPVQRYSATALARAIGEGFEVVEQRDELHETPGGKTQPFQFVAFKRVS